MMILIFDMIFIFVDVVARLFFQFLPYDICQYKYSYKYKLSQINRKITPIPQMQMQCRNYMQQYSRTKSIREINKTRSSYKQLLQNSKTRQSSNNHGNLKLSANKKCSQKFDKNVSNIVDHLMESSTPSFLNKDLQPLTSTQNIHNGNINANKLNSKMKLKVTSDKSMRSLSSNQQLKPHNIVAASMANIGVGLASQKKKPKLVTLTTNSSQINTTSKKAKKQSQLSVRKQHQNSHSIQRSQNNSALNSKYSTNMAHQAAYMSIRRNKQKQMEINSNNVEIITLNTSLAHDCEGNSNQKQKKNQKSLEKVYERVKQILQSNKEKQKQWQIERNFYKAKIKLLQKQLQQNNKKQYPNKPTKNTITQPHFHSSITSQSNINHNISNNSSYYNHAHSSSVNLFNSVEDPAYGYKNGNRKFTCNR